MPRTPCIAVWSLLFLVPWLLELGIMRFLRRELSTSGTVELKIQSTQGPGPEIIVMVCSLRNFWGSQEKLCNYTLLFFPPSRHQSILDLLCIDFIPSLGSFEMVAQGLVSISAEIPGWDHHTFHGAALLSLSCTLEEDRRSKLQVDKWHFSESDLSPWNGLGSVNSVVDWVCEHVTSAFIRNYM